VRAVVIVIIITTAAALRTQQRCSGKASDPVTVKITPPLPPLVHLPLLVITILLYIYILYIITWRRRRRRSAPTKFPTAAPVSRDDYDYITGTAIIPSARVFPHRRAIALARGPRARACHRSPLQHKHTGHTSCGHPRYRPSVTSWARNRFPKGESTDRTEETGTAATYK